MTDLEITRLCAEAMGYTVEPFNGTDRPYRLIDKDGDYVMGIGSGWIMSKYNPLHDDAQAMALVKKFRLRIGFASAVDWLVEGEMGSSRWPDLNRAICECVAKLKQGENGT